MPAAKKPTKKTQKPTKAGTSLAAAAHRRELFVAAYLTNGNNGTAAAIAAGFSAKTASQKAHKLLSDPAIASRVTQVAEKVAFDAGLSVERWAREMACIGHFDPAELYDAAGNLIPIHALPEHVRRAIASVEPMGGDEGGVKVKLWDKPAALASIGKHLGTFERDNHQRAEGGIKVLVQLVG